MTVEKVGVWWFGTVTKSLKRRLAELEFRGTIETIHTTNAKISIKIKMRA